MGGSVLKNVEICNYYHYSQKSEIVHYFSLQIFDVHTHFFCKNVTSRARKKSCFFFQPIVSTKGNCQRFVDFGQLWNKKCLIFLHINIVVLTKRKKFLTSFFFCLHFGNLEEKTTLKKTKQKALFFFPKCKCSLLFLGMGKLCLKQNEHSFVI